MNKLVKYHILSLLLLVFFQNSSAQQVTDSAFNAATLNVYDNPDKAIDIGIQMFKTSPGHRKKIDALLLLSNAYSSKREYEKAIDYAFKARDLSKKHNDARYEIMVLNKIAAQYHQLGVNDKALQFLDESDLIIAAYPYRDSITMLLGNNYGVRSFIYRDQLSCDIAIDYLNHSIRQYKTDENNPKMLANMSIMAYNKGNCFITLAQNDSARINFQNSLSYALRAEAKSLEAFSRKGLAEVYTLEGNYAQSIDEINKALDISKNVGDLVLNQGLYKGLAENYLATNKWDEYRYYFNKYLQMEAQNKAEERKTISISLAKHSEEVDEQIVAIKSSYTVAICIASIIILTLVFLIISGQIAFRKQFKSLKSQLKFTQKP